MDSKKIRESFFQFFRDKNHKIVESAPMVVKNDPSLMFTNAGMNQFKDIFLGNRDAKYPRVADAQKCLRVSGKHNDLDEVGHDTYHHTMFEMLGNWSFGDYFKKEAIEWSYEYLVSVLKIDSDRLYATIFEGDEEINVPRDEEAYAHWKKLIPGERILDGSKKDNFWEMGDTGPCGPCSEIHIDLRPDAERKNKDGAELVNQDHHLVIEIWNLVFIQYNKKSDGTLQSLPQKHVDTGMGFERLCMTLQEKKSNYDTDIFQPLIKELETMANIQYGSEEQTDIAMRVISDHIRAISFSIADGQLPSNIKAGYVIRRILRRAVRYGYTFLNFSNPFLYKLVPALIQVMGKAYPELMKQESLIMKVIHEEEKSFLKTLSTGLKLLDQIMEKIKSESKKTVDGKTAFELYDTYGFPLDLTELILKEKGFKLDKDAFNSAMKQQKDRSRNASSTTTDDWVILKDDQEEEFVGYDYLESDIYITRYRKLQKKDKVLYQLVFNHTPFYAESGGQVGDTGYISANGEKIAIIDTKKENDLIVHLSKNLPKDPYAKFYAVVNKTTRQSSANNHTATHLLHYALKKILGNHIEQKGSLVHPDYLRFDFSHFEKINENELEKVEKFVNELIRKNIQIEEKRHIPLNKARDMGAISLFGEKYGDVVRVIRFGDSIELCGGTHVESTGEIGLFKIISESAISAGVRRIEALTSEKALEYVNNKIELLKEVHTALNSPKNILNSVNSLLQDHKTLQKKLDTLIQDKARNIKSELLNSVQNINGINFIGARVKLDSPAAIKDLIFQMKNELSRFFIILGAEINGKPNLSLMISEELIAEKDLNAAKIIREISKEIKGGGGGQPFYATAGGKEPSGIEKAIALSKDYL